MVTRRRFGLLTPKPTCLERGLGTSGTSLPIRAGPRSVRFYRWLGAVPRPPRSKRNAFSGRYSRFRSLLNNHILPAKLQPSSDLESSPRTLVSYRSARGLPPTVATARQLASPLLPFVCGLAGPCMGGVFDRYVQYQAAGDQVCGRTVAGLDVNSYEFSVSPPFFDPSRPLLRDDGTAADVEGVVWT
jgi:hypothetical protein